MSIKDQLFSQFAENGFNQVLSEMVKQYQSKKGQRFSVDDITYEIGMPTVSGQGITFEISSKIPEEKLFPNTDLKTYFNAIKKLVGKEKVKPTSIAMENIVQMEKVKEKSRDYVKLNYFYPFKDIYNEKDIEKKILSSGHDKDFLKTVPHVSGIVTLGGRLVLLAIQTSMYEKCKTSIQSLINANTKVRKELKIS